MSPVPLNAELTELPGGTVSAPVENPPLAEKPGIVLLTVRPVSSMEPELVTVMAPVPAPEPLGTTSDAWICTCAVFCALLAVVVK